MYQVICQQAQLGNTVFKSYWCGGKLWEAGVTRVSDADMTPELLKTLEEDKVHGLNRITVEYFETEIKPVQKQKTSKK